jgi:hypothetical protein
MKTWIGIHEQTHLQVAVTAPNLREAGERIAYQLATDGHPEMADPDSWNITLLNIHTEHAGEFAYLGTPSLFP